MPNLHTVPAHEPIAARTAAWMLSQFSPEALARAIVLVPTRRAAFVMRNAFAEILAGKAALLPRMIPLADLGNELLTLLGDDALGLLEQIPPAMSDTQRRYLLAQQVMAFERRRLGSVSLDYALTLTDALITLQDDCARAGIVMTQETLRPLRFSDVAFHWKQALQFLEILTDTWPAIERALGLITAPTRELRILEILAAHWATHPLGMDVIAVGSTASGHATAQLLKVIADSARGHVVLPGLDSSMGANEWASIAAGHPLFHLKQFLAMWPVAPSLVESLTPNTRSIWLDALAPMRCFIINRMPHGSSDHPIIRSSLPRLIPCAHPEEEARVIALLLRESLESAEKKVALITPDEGLMARVASHLTRDGVNADRLSAGTLATTQTGSLWAALIAAVTQPDRLLLLRALLHHPLLAVDSTLLDGLEKGWHGVNRHRAGQLPRHEASLKNHSQFAMIENLVHSINRLSTLRTAASAWVDACRALLLAWVNTSGQGHEAVAQQLDALADADDFGPIDAEDFAFRFSRNSLLM